MSKKGLMAKVICQNYPKCEPEHLFHPTRKWRFDFAWPEQKIALEFEGGTWTGGAHTRGKHYESDCIKYSEAAILGWKVIRGTTDMFKDGRVFELLDRAMGKKTLVSRIQEAGM